MGVVVCPLMSNGMNYSPCRADCALYSDGECLLKAYLAYSLPKKSSDGEKRNSIAGVNNLSGNS